MGVPMSRSDDKRRGNRFLANAVARGRDMVSLRDQTIQALRQEVAELVAERDEARAELEAARVAKCHICLQAEEITHVCVSCLVSYQKRMLHAEEKIRQITAALEGRDG